MEQKSTKPQRNNDSFPKIAKDISSGNLGINTTDNKSDYINSAGYFSVDRNKEIYRKEIGFSKLWHLMS